MKPPRAAGAEQEYPVREPATLFWRCSDEGRVVARDRRDHSLGMDDSREKKDEEEETTHE